MRVLAKDGTVWHVRRVAVAPGQPGAPVRRMETGDKFTDDYTFARAVPGIFIAKALMAVGAYFVSLVLVPVCLLGRRPWLVTARQAGRARRTHVWQVAGNRESRALVGRVAATLHEGRRLSGVRVDFNEPLSISDRPGPPAM